MTVFVVFVGDGRGLFTAVAVRMGRAAWLEVPRARFGTGHDFGNHSWAAATKLACYARVVGDGWSALTQDLHVGLSA